jgi:hypothetical protein
LLLVSAGIMPRRNQKRKLDGAHRLNQVRIISAPDTTQTYEAEFMF